MDVKNRLLYKIFCYCETHFSLHVIILFLKRSILIKLSGPWSIQQSCFAVSFSQKVLNQKPLFSGACWPGQEQGLSHFPQHWVSRVSWPPRGHPGDTQGTPRSSDLICSQDRAGAAWDDCGILFYSAEQRPRQHMSCSVWTGLPVSCRTVTKSLRAGLEGAGEEVLLQF